MHSSSVDHRYSGVIIDDASSDDSPRNSKPPQTIDASLLLFSKSKAKVFESRLQQPPQSWVAKESRLVLPPLMALLTFRAMISPSVQAEVEQHRRFFSTFPETLTEEDK
jgi:hypothetical protein